MEEIKNMDNSAGPAVQKESEPEVLKSATKLSPLDLNGIKMDIRHTVLTPDYLDKISTK